VTLVTLVTQEALVILETLVIQEEQEVRVIHHLLPLKILRVILKLLLLTLLLQPIHLQLREERVLQ
jgi:hypothetical protein